MSAPTQVVMSAREQVLEMLFNDSALKTEDVKFFPGSGALCNTDAMWESFLSALSQERDGRAVITAQWPDKAEKKSLEQIISSL